MSLLILIVINLLFLAGLALFVNRRLTRLVQRQGFLKRIRSEIEAILVECNQTTDRNLALIEGRIHGLKALVEQADQRAMLLRRSFERPSAPPDYGELGYRAQSMPPIGPTAEPAPRPRPEPSEEQAGQSESSPRPKSTEETAPHPEQSPQARQIEPPDRRSRIVELSRAGLRPEEIALQLGVPIGEVELVLSLEGDTSKYD